MRDVYLCILFFQAALGGAERVCVRDVVVPGYSRLARVAHLQGSVKVQIEIHRDGKVSSVKTSGAHPLLMRDAENNARQWVFGPLPKDSIFPLHHTIVYVYKLEGIERYYDPPPRVTLQLPDRVEIISNPMPVQPSGSQTRSR